MIKRNSLKLFLAMLAAFALLAASCGSDSSADDAADEDTTADDAAADDEEAAEEDDEDAAADDEDAAADDEAMEDDDEAMEDEAAEPVRIAVVAPSASNDLAFTQSMVDALAAIGETREIEVDVTDGTFIVDDAAAAIRGYAEDGFDLVIAHGSQYGGPLAEIAPDFPEVSFAWGTTTDTFDLDNVFAYTTRSDEGGYVMGTIAAMITESDVIGVVGPVEVGDAKLYVDGFVAGAEAQEAGVTVNVNYIDSFSDVALAAEAAEAHVSSGADVLTGTAQMVVGATGVAREQGLPWFGTQANQTTLGEDNVVVSQVYHWEVVLDEILNNIEAGTLGGEVYGLSLENGGLVMEYNDAFELSDEVRAAADEIVAGLSDGSLTTGIE